MAKIDLKPLSLKDLQALRKRIDTAIARHDKKQKAKALAAVKAKAKELGFSLSELTGGAKAAGSKPKKAAKAKPKVTHRDPANAANTWGGRGPRPAWLKEAIAKGKSPDDFKI
ncbi:H-NS histone family protein [uncultured Litoreibacter sp.]|uniref:H-NS histone family protein n=1 Tax=uncultured Litoreibacter sp. TaxID=1392394 RepID=UPI0026267EBD|nr:H-NS histone family protein [uncultured Litoreibacter sp.]